MIFRLAGWIAALPVAFPENENPILWWPQPLQSLPSA
jgi:hypothetical protein